VKEIIESQKIGTRKTRKDAVLVNELLVTSDRDFFERLDPSEQKRFFEESYKLFSERYGKQNIAYATVHHDEQTPHMHLGGVLMQQFIMMSKTLTCMRGLCLCVMENCKGKTCLIVKNCYGYKINSPSICKNKALSWNVEKKALIVNISKQPSLKNRLWKKRLL